MYESRIGGMIKPVAETADTVTLRRADYEALLKEVVVNGAGQMAIPAEVQQQLRSGLHPVTVWRQHRALTARALAALAGVAPSYLSEIENRRKPGSLEAIVRIARALELRLEWLVDREADTGSL